jgi:hypothetical protein
MRTIPRPVPSTPGRQPPPPPLRGRRFAPLRLPLRYGLASPVARHPALDCFQPPGHAPRRPVDNPPCLRSPAFAPLRSARRSATALPVSSPGTERMTTFSPQVNRRRATLPAGRPAACPWRSGRNRSHAHGWRMDGPERYGGPLLHSVCYAQGDRATSQFRRRPAAPAEPVEAADYRGPADLGRNCMPSLRRRPPSPRNTAPPAAGAGAAEYGRHCRKWRSPTLANTPEIA